MLAAPSLEQSETRPGRWRTPRMALTKIDRAAKWNAAEKSEAAGAVSAPNPILVLLPRRQHSFLKQHIHASTAPRLPQRCPPLHPPGPARPPLLRQREHTHHLRRPAVRPRCQGPAALHANRQPRPQPCPCAPATRSGTCTRSRCRRCLTTAATTGPATAPLSSATATAAVHPSQPSGPRHTQQPCNYTALCLCVQVLQLKNRRERKIIIAAPTSRGAAHRILRNQSTKPGRCRSTAAHNAHHSHLAP